MLTGILNTISSFTLDLEKEIRKLKWFAFDPKCNQVSMKKHLWNVLSSLCPGLIASR
jgi:hypothetical protein